VIGGVPVGQNRFNQVIGGVPVKQNRFNQVIEGIPFEQNTTGDFPFPFLLPFSASFICFLLLKKLRTAQIK